MPPGGLLFPSFSHLMTFKFVRILRISININFKVPKVPKKIEEKKILVVEPKKMEVPPAKDICHYKTK